MKKITVKLTFVEPLLGSQPSNPNIYLDYVASKAPEDERIKIEDEVAALGVQEVADKVMTVFPRTADGAPFIYDYQIKGFFKSACSALRKIKQTRSAGIKAFKKEIDQLIFVYPRQIRLNFDGNIRRNERSLRADTPQGARTAIAVSQEVSAGTHTGEFVIFSLIDDDEKLIYEWLNYGILHGLGQWRNAGFGRFKWELVSVEEAEDFDGAGVMRFAMA